MKAKLLENSQATQEQQIYPSDEVIHKLIELMRSVDLNASDAVLNATSISDGKGGRIFL